MHRHPPWYAVWSSEGFSWEWFDRESETIFRKRQGPGRVNASFLMKHEKLELTAVEFSEDVTFRLYDNSWFRTETEKTHQMVVRAGSVLQLTQ